MVEGFVQIFTTAYSWMFCGKLIRPTWFEIRQFFGIINLSELWRFLKNLTWFCFYERSHSPCPALHHLHSNVVCEKCFLRDNVMTAHMLQLSLKHFFFLCCGIMGSHVKANEKLRLIFNTSLFLSYSYSEILHDEMKKEVRGWRCYT